MAYSPEECVEGEFCALRVQGVLRSAPGDGLELGPYAGRHAAPLDSSSLHFVCVAEPNVCFAR